MSINVCEMTEYEPIGNDTKMVSLDPKGWIFLLYKILSINSNTIQKHTNILCATNMKINKHNLQKGG